MRNEHLKVVKMKASASSRVKFACRNARRARPMFQRKRSKPSFRQNHTDQDTFVATQRIHFFHHRKMTRKAKTPLTVHCTRHRRPERNTITVNVKPTGALSETWVSNRKTNGATGSAGSLERRNSTPTAARTARTQRPVRCQCKTKGAEIKFQPPHLRQEKSG